jgi:hypothetical protein
LVCLQQQLFPIAAAIVLNHLGKPLITCEKCANFSAYFAVLRIRIRMNPHDFGLLDPHLESAFQMQIPDADADPG